MSQEFDVEAQRLAYELKTNNPEAAAGELRNELYRAEQYGTQGINRVEALKDRANEIAGPCANHLQVSQAYGRPDVQVIPSNCGGQNYYSNQYPGQYNPYGGSQYYNQAPPPGYGYQPQPGYGGPGINFPIPGLNLLFRFGHH